MIKHLVGGFAVSFFSFAPTFVPGAMSLIGLIISHLALVLALASVVPNLIIYFRVVLAIVLVGLLLVNDALSIYGAMPEVRLQFKFVTYGLSLFAAPAGCVKSIYQHWSSRKNRDRILSN